MARRGERLRPLAGGAQPGLLTPFPSGLYAWKNRAKGSTDSHCRPCRRDYGREHYLANKARYIAQAAVIKAKLRQERTQFLIDYFTEHPCVDCGESDPVVLEFDHLGDKRFEIGSRLCSYSWQTVLDEIAKCEVVCANCHRVRTARRRGSLRLLLSE